MKIALVNTSPPKTGVGRRAFSVFQEFKKMKKDVDMIYANYNYQKFTDPKIKSIKAIKLPFLRQALNDYFYLPKHIPNNYDIYHLESQGLGIYLKYIKKPSLVTVHDIAPFIFKKELPSLLNILAIRSIKHIKKANKIITVSNATKNDLIKYLKIQQNKIVAIHSGCDNEIFKKKKIKSTFKQKVILHVGTEMPRKNVEIIIRSLYKLKKEIPNILLIRIGEKTNKISNLINRLNLQKNVTYLQNISGEKLADLYNMADVLIFPSLYEGFGFPLLEAMACGCPVITSNISSMPEIVGNAAIKINPKDLNEITHQIKNVLTNPSLKEKLSKNGIKRAKLFTWENCAKKIFKVYEELNL